jgi:hypothetical protein
MQARPLGVRSLPASFDQRVTIRKHSISVAMLALAVACDSGTEVCPALPCAAPVAIVAAVRSATGLTIPTAFVQERDSLGAVVQTTDCGSDSCWVGFRAGTYRLHIAAPGFMSRDTTVNVTAADSRPCSCVSLHTQQLAVTLIIIPPPGV